LRAKIEKSGGKAVALRWAKQPRAGIWPAHPGIYCLRSNETRWFGKVMSSSEIDNHHRNLFRTAQSNSQIKVMHTCCFHTHYAFTL